MPATTSSEEGWLTRTVEKIPVVGYVASAAHAVAGNGDQARRAAENCTGSTVTALGVVTGAVMTTTATVGVVTGGVVSTLATLSMITWGVVATVKTLVVVTRAVMGTVTLVGKCVKAVIAVAGGSDCTEDGERKNVDNMEKDS
eukprot:GFUD01033711.1.p1 GENE.GFUD01033711.1~~GFUD01033711.1.p1  ORF type:complete len:158 (+),score=33.52 GFUD01033711.1:47-475(+)